MKNSVEPLPYARPMPAPSRPTMFRLVVTILFATVVIVLGIVASVTFFVLLLQPNGRLFSIVPLGVASVFFYMGIRSLTVAVQFLRGKTPGEHWERWIFSIWSTWM
jgi:hypothetical protein